MKHFISILTILFCHFSCSQPNSSDDMNAEAVSPSSSIPSLAEIDQLFVSAIRDGSVEAYQRAEAYYLVEGGDDGSLFYYAFVMAKKHKNARAYFDLYYIMAGGSPGIKPIDELDASTSDFALYCLLRSYELNDRSAKICAEELFPKAIPKSKSYRQAIFE